MSWRRWFTRIRGASGGLARRADLDAAFAEHLAELEQNFRDQGFDEREARAAARRTFGSPILARLESESDRLPPCQRSATRL